MTQNTTHPPRPDQDARDLDVRAIVAFAIGLSILIIVAGVLMWFVSAFLRGLEEARDPPAPVLLEARETPARPGAILQEYPLEEMRALRDSERQALESYTWVDRPAGVAAIPIERAMELMVEEKRTDAATTPLEATDE